MWTFASAHPWIFLVIWFLGVLVLEGAIANLAKVLITLFMRGRRG